MAGTITALKFQKRNRERVNIYLDGEYALALTAVAAAELRIGQFLSDAEIAALQAADARDKAYQSAVRFLGYRPRSRQEIERHLQGKGIPADVVESVLDRLAREEYLDDRAFAAYWVENRERFKPRRKK